MFRSLQKLAELPDETILLPGHNYSARGHATMAETKKTNAYMRINNLDSWKMMMGG
jgi:glyoxylase-like metal-dependent hydrolase (beta-lactamase superfamily II)